MSHQNSLFQLKNEIFISKVDFFSIREHIAEKRGKHLDYALGSKNLEVAIDFIVPKGLPKINERPRLGIMMELHDPIYLFDKKGDIEEGYGKGTWKQIKCGPAKIVRKSNHSWIINLGNEQYNFYIPPPFQKKKGQFLIKRMK
ncbi:MAG: hypothetical protein HWN67_01470 [Candidatus Helarchaeota archaeon]|nr:hypothetical protein [Candidatus Helarchaeota archaeon]